MQTVCEHFEAVAERGKGHLTPTVPRMLRGVSDMLPFLLRARLPVMRALQLRLTGMTI